MGSYWLPIEAPIWAALQRNDVCDWPVKSIPQQMWSKSPSCVGVVPAAAWRYSSSLTTHTTEITLCDVTAL